MSVTDPLAALASVSPESLRAKPCLVIRAVAEADEKHQETLRFLIDESGHSGPRIAQAAERAGIRLSREAIQRHRQKGCKCLAA